MFNDFPIKTEAHIHTLDGGLDEVTIIGRLNDQQYLAEYKGVRCTAIFNGFVCRFYVDDKYGVIRDAPVKKKDGPVR